LLPLKQYTQLNKEKFKIWFNFITTFKELANDDFFNIEQVRTLTMFSERLVRDYDYTAKSEATRRAQEWKHLTEKEQKEFIEYLARKKTREQQQTERKEQELNAEAQEWEAEIARELEIDNHHKERGKIGCECWSCAIGKEVKKELEESEEKLWKELDEKEEEEKAECANCGKVRELNEDEVCGKCEKESSE